MKLNTDPLGKIIMGDIDFKDASGDWCTLQTDGPEIFLVNEDCPIIHLDRPRVQSLVAHLQAWLDTGSLELPAE